MVQRFDNTALAYFALEGSCTLVLWHSQLISPCVSPELFHFPSSYQLHLAKQRQMVQVLVLLPPMWENQMEFPVPDSHLAQPLQTNVYKEWISSSKFSVSFVCNYTFQIKNT